MKICSVEGCGKPVKSRDLCSSHTMRKWRYGNPLISKGRTHEMHGLRHTPEYDCWHALIDRCTKGTNKFYKRYGGRGIKVCDRWLYSFTNFINDMGPRPTNDHQIDRIDNDGDYEPSNCQWLPRIENTRKSPNVKLSIESVRELRKIYATGRYMIKDIAKLVNADPSHMGKILKGKHWVDLELVVNPLSYLETP